MFESLIKKVFLNGFYARIRKNAQNEQQKRTKRKSRQKNKLILQKRDKKPLTKKVRRAIISMFWGYGSVGRAPRSQRGGQRFESA